MNKNRYLLCLLASGMMLYYALPNLSINSDGAAGVFSLSWIVLSLFVIAGNLSALLFTPKVSKVSRKQGLKRTGRKVRVYY